MYSFARLNNVEALTMKMLLEGEHPILDILREQLKMATVLSRTYTGHGVFTKFHVPETAPRLPDRKKTGPIGDVYAEMEGMEHGAGFLLFLADGAISTLEAFANADEYPERASLIRAYYVHPMTPGAGALCETAARNLAWALQRLR